MACTMPTTMSYFYLLCSLDAITTPFEVLEDREILPLEV